MGARPPGADDAERCAAAVDAGAPAAPRLVLRCRNCGHAIAAQDDQVSVGGEPPIRSFVNPHGFVHEVLTVSDAPGMRSGGPRYGADSWFPGYAWQIGICSRCGVHLGWEYSAQHGATPSRFAGLRRAAVVGSQS